MAWTDTVEEAKAFYEKNAGPAISRIDATSDKKILTDWDKKCRKSLLKINAAIRALPNDPMVEGYLKNLKIFKEETTKTLVKIEDKLRS